MQEEKSVCIIGLGYVGLPLACLCAKNGYKVFGFDTHSDKVEKINQGISPIDDEELKQQVSELKGKISAFDDERVIANSSIVIVCVPTPVDESKNPDLNPLIEACKSIKKNMRKNQLIIIESTVNPGVTRKIVLPILESSSMKAGKDFFLGYCPERIDPGNVVFKIEKIARVVGGIDEASLEKTSKFYESIIDAKIKKLNSMEAAEAVKIFENTFRDVNIAFVNELAMSFARMNIDIKEVIEGASTKPFGFMAFYPGPGCGGHCIPVDPYYLINDARLNGFHHEFLSHARKINESMPLYVVELIQNALNEKSKAMQNSKIAVLGVAYKANVDDIRESPSLEVIHELQKRKANLKIFDPHVKHKSNVESFEQALKDSDLVVVLTHHSFFVENLSPKLLKQHNIDAIIDARNCLNKEAFEKEGIYYKGIGR
ncbi:MAG: nucleotide sugar dehydrogenase [archaeon]|nr:nucleotide sugar dehydrogenase [archaeon]